jgi:hypothetical protein
MKANVVFKKLLLRWLFFFFFFQATDAKQAMSYRFRKTKFLKYRDDVLIFLCFTIFNFFFLNLYFKNEEKVFLNQK